MVLGIEGEYSNVKTDRGGETYCGISRVKNPGWIGWPIIDSAMKSIGQLPVRQLRQHVEEFYRNEFWLPINGNDLNSDMALDIFEAAVNCGVGTAIKFLQKALNLTNRQQKLWPDIPCDGHFGPMTLQAVYKALATDHGEVILRKTFDVCQGKYYIDIVENDPGQEENFRGWINKRIGL
jgi:lysozyme family protein